MSHTNRLLLLVAATLIAAGPAAAQTHATDKGSFQVTGSASFSSTSDEDEDERVTTLSLTPGVRYFIIPGLAIGADLQYIRSSPGDAIFTNYGIGPAATYYFGGADSRTRQYVGANLQWMKGKFELGAQESEDTGTGYGAAAGILFLLSSSVGLNAELFYRDQSFDRGAFERGSNTFGLAVGIAAFIF